MGAADIPAQCADWIALDLEIDRLARRWSDLETLAVRQFDYFKDALRLKFREIMTSLSKEEQDYAATSKDYNGTVQRNFEAEIESLKSGDMRDLNVVAIRLICRGRFYYTDAEKIL